MKTKITITRQERPDSEAYEQVYEYELSEGMSLLNALEDISRDDSTLCYSHCCDNACCGICAVMCNGKPGLMCRIKAVENMSVAPLKNLAVARDLIIDRSAYDARRAELRLYSSRAGREGEEPARVPSEEQARVKTASRCIECLSCLAVCPAYALDKERFAGPCHFALVARHALDCRDETDRAETVARMNGELCIRCGRCSSVCPVDAQPARMIELLKEKYTG